MDDKQLRMVFFVRTDLKMPKGKIAAQVGHAVQELILKNMNYPSEVFQEWLEGDHVKICLKVSSEEELNELHLKGLEIPTHVSFIIDKGYTCFDNKETPTVVGWGPLTKEEHQELTKNLKLL